MFSYMVELNDAESFLVGYSNYETVQKIKERQTETFTANGNE